MGYLGRLPTEPPQHSLSMIIGALGNHCRLPAESGLGSICGAAGGWRQQGESGDFRAPIWQAPIPCYPYSHECICATTKE